MSGVYEVVGTLGRPVKTEKMKILLYSGIVY